MTLFNSRVALIACFICIAPLAAPQAGPELSAKHFENPEMVGKARFSYLFWDVYDAQLLSPGGVFKDDGPMALSLTYLRNLKGEAIVESSLKEIRRQGMADEVRLSAWEDELSRIIPDVKDQDSIAGVRDHDGRTFFYVNGTPAGKIDDAEFGRYFFNIWLGPDSSDRDFTSKLKGG